MAKYLINLDEIIGAVTWYYGEKYFIETSYGTFIWDVSLETLRYRVCYNRKQYCEDEGIDGLAYPSCG